MQERAERSALSTALGRGGKALTWVAPAPWARSGLQASAEHQHPPRGHPGEGSSYEAAASTAGAHRTKGIGKGPTRASLQRGQVVDFQQSRESTAPQAA